MGQIMSTWLNLGTDTAETGNIPSHIAEDSRTFLRIIQQETERSRATFPTNILRTYVDSTKFIQAQVHFNLYKEGTPTANYEFGNTELLLKSLRTRQAYSSNLKYATNRVGLVTSDGICYADEYNSLIPKDDYKLFKKDMQLVCDGLITDTPKVSLIGYAADCVLCKIEDAETGAIGIFHAGWRNLIGKGENFPKCKPNIVEEIVYRMSVEFGTDPKKIKATIFPCISTDTFKVSPDIAISFAKAGLEDCIVEEAELWEYYIDLRLAVSKLLVQNGVEAKNIAIIPYTTDDAYFYSKRLSRKAVAETDYKLLASTEYVQRTERPDSDKPVVNINPQNLLIVKKF